MEKIILCFILNIFDFFSGIVVALKTKSLKSSKMRDGFFKKIGFIFCYFLAYFVDTYGNTIGFNIEISILSCVCIYVASTEIVSILENIVKINPNLKLKIFEIFKEFTKNGREENKK